MTTFIKQTASTITPVAGCIAFTVRRSSPAPLPSLLSKSLPPPESSCFWIGLDKPYVPHRAIKRGKDLIAKPDSREIAKSHEKLFNEGQILNEISGGRKITRSTLILYDKKFSKWKFCQPHSEPHSQLKARDSSRQFEAVVSPENDGLAINAEEKNIPSCRGHLQVLHPFISW